MYTELKKTLHKIPHSRSVRLVSLDYAVYTLFTEYKKVFARI